jgi:hypothetical protein
VKSLAGERHHQRMRRRARRWRGGWTRCRSGGRDLTLSTNGSGDRPVTNCSSTAARCSGHLGQRMRGLSIRNYDAALQEFQDAHGIEDSAVDDHRCYPGQRLKEWMKRPLIELRLCALVMDGTPCKRALDDRTSGGLQPHSEMAGSCALDNIDSEKPARGGASAALSIRRW